LSKGKGYTYGKEEKAIEWERKAIKARNKPFHEVASMRKYIHEENASS